MTGSCTACVAFRSPQAAFCEQRISSAPGRGMGAKRALRGLSHCRSGSVAPPCAPCAHAPSRQPPVPAREHAWGALPSILVSERGPSATTARNRWWPTGLSRPKLAELHTGTRGTGIVSAGRCSEVAYSPGVLKPPRRCARDTARPATPHAGLVMEISGVHFSHGGGQCHNPRSFTPYASFYPSLPWP